MCFRGCLRVAGFLTASLMAAHCAGRLAAPQAILLITLDTTRADRLGCYGYQGAETPTLDRLAQESVLFLNAQSPVPVTLPSHATMFTGLYPPHHGVRYNGMFRLSDKAVTVAERLRAAGWRTVGVPASFPLNARTGIGQGFEVYRDMFEEDPSLRGHFAAERRAKEVSDLGVHYLQELAGQRFFLWLHYWDPHYPYRPPFPYSSRFRDRPYDGEIAYMDRELGRVFEAVRELGLWEKTLIVVAGDHGEGLYDHGEKMHQNLVYQSTLHVPLMIKPPGWFRARRVAEPVSLADLAPTILDLVGVAHGEMEGVSLRPALEGRALGRRPVYFEAHAGWLVYGWSPLEGVREGPWKYIRAPEPELYDLEHDPDEERNLYVIETERATALERTLTEMEARWRELDASAEVASTPTDPRTLEALASLGYLGGFVSDEHRGGPDPKRMVHLENEAFAARDEMASGEFRAALRRLLRVLEEDPTNRHALHMAARAALRLGEQDQALDLARRALEIYPEFTPARILHADILIARGDIPRAAQVLREGLEYHPEDEGLQYRLAAALYAMDRLDEAENILLARLAKGVRSPAFLVLRAACLAKRGRDQQALEVLKLAIERGYRDREVLETEPLLAPLRRVTGFREVVADIGAREVPAS